VGFCENYGWQRRQQMGAMERLPDTWLKGGAEEPSPFKIQGMCCTNPVEKFNQKSDAPAEFWSVTVSSKAHCFILKTLQITGYI
jgi:hypothetical protein